MKSEKHLLTEENVMEIATMSDNYSGADMKTLCSEASLGPIRSLDLRLIEKIEATEVRVTYIILLFLISIIFFHVF